MIKGEDAMVFLDSKGIKNGTYEAASGCFLENPCEQ